jgi:hypothetical protein
MHSTRTRGAACSSIPNSLNLSIDFRAVMLEQDLLLLANYRLEYFRLNASNGITVHAGSAVRAVGPCGLVRGHGIDGKTCGRGYQCSTGREDTRQSTQEEG